MDLWSLINKNIDCPSCQEARAAAAFDSVWVSSPSLQASTICVSNVHIVCFLPSCPQKAPDSMPSFPGDKKRLKLRLKVREIMTDYLIIRPTVNYLAANLEI